MRSQDFSSDEKKGDYIKLESNANAMTRRPVNPTVMLVAPVKRHKQKTNTNRESLLNRKQDEVRLYTLFLSRPFPFHFVLLLK